MFKRLSQTVLNRRELAFQIAFAFVFYCSFVLIVFWDPLIHQFGSIQWDAVEVHFMSLRFASEQWHNGVFPQWTPYLFGGFPQIADPQVAFFYPINVVLIFLFVFTPELVMYQLIFHYFLAALFAFLFARHLSKNLFFALAAGIVYAFGGFMVGHASHVGMQNTATWLPLIFLLCMQTIKAQKTVYAALCGLFLGIAILAGHFQMALYTVYALGVYVVFEIMWTGVVNVHKGIQQNFSNILRPLSFLLIIYAIAFLVASVQILPTYELVSRSYRTGLSLQISQTESLNPQSLWSLVDPNYNNVSYGGPYRGPWDKTQNYLYISITMLALSAIGLIVGIVADETRKITLFWFLFLLSSLIYSFGQYGFLQEFYYRFVPFFDKVRAPSNMMLLFNLSVIGLACVCVERIGYWFLGRTNQKSAKEIPLHVKATHPWYKHVQIRANGYLGLGILVVVTVEILNATLPNTLLFARRYPNEIVYYKPDIVETVLQEYSVLNEADKFRVFKILPYGSNLSQMLGILNFDGYNPLVPVRFWQYVEKMSENESLVDLAGIKYLPCESIPARSDKLERIDAFCVNDRYFGQVFFVEDCTVASSREDVWQKLKTVDLSKYVVLEEEPQEVSCPMGSIGDSYNQEHTITVVEAKPGFWKLSTRNPKNAFLVVSQANYPGWLARIDDQRVRVYQANYLFQAVFVPAGDHEITLRFESQPLKVGIALAVTGLFLVLVILIRAVSIFHT